MVPTHFKDVLRAKNKTIISFGLVDAMKGGLALFKEKVDKELGGWPLTGSVDMDKWQLEDNLATMKYLSHVPLFKVYVDKDFINPTQHKIHVSHQIVYPVTHSPPWPLSYFSFQPVLHDWCNKRRDMCYPVCVMVHIKENPCC